MPGKNTQINLLHDTITIHRKYSQTVTHSTHLHIELSKGLFGR